ncbi:MAG: tetratricopeptide repeat protein [Bacteroidetes bacterium]|nr:tetratricopeptide repeat protein [Bacteroidota bacterium]
MKNIFILIAMVALASCSQINRYSNTIDKNSEGINYMNQNLYEKAISSFREALALHLNDKEVLNTIYRNMSIAFYQTDQLDSAVKYSFKAASLYPKDSYEYLVNQADALTMSDKVDEALVMLHQAYELNPKDIAVNNSLGLIYLGESGDEYYDPDQALEYNLNAYNINKDRATEGVLALNYFELDNYEKARYHYYKISIEYPNDAENLFQLGLTEFYDGKTEMAMNYFERAVKIDPEYQDAVDDVLEEVTESEEPNQD